MSRHFFHKRFGALAILLSLSLILGACAKPEEEPKPTYQGTLTLWAAAGLAGQEVAAPAEAWFRERAEAYEKLHDGVQVELRFFSSPDELESEALQALTADLLFGRPLPALAPHLADLEGLQAERLGEYHPNGLEAYRSDGKLTGLPVLLEVYGLALHHQRFQESGAALPADGRWTVEAFDESLRKLSVDGYYGLGFYNLPRYHEWWAFSAGVLQQDGSIAAGAEEGLNRLNRWRSERLLHPDTAKVKAEEIWAHFAEGRIAIMPVATWAIPLLRAEPYSASFSVAAFPGDLTIGQTYGFSLRQQEDELKLAAALDLAAFMAAPDQQVRLARETGLMPASKAAENPFEQDQQLTQAFQLAPLQRPLPAGPTWDAAQPAIAEALLRALIGAEAPSAALNQIKSAMTPAE